MASGWKNGMRVVSPSFALAASRSRLGFRTLPASTR